MNLSDPCPSTDVEHRPAIGGWMALSFALKAAQSQGAIKGSRPSPAPSEARLCPARQPVAELVK